MSTPSSLLVYSMPVHTSNTTRSIYYIELFQDFTLPSISGLPTVRRYCWYTLCYSESISLEYAAVFPGSILWIYSVLALIGLQHNCSHTPSTRSISAASITPILSVLAARNKCTRYSEHTWNICCDAGCCSCCFCCCCLSGASAVDVPPSLAA